MNRKSLFLPLAALTLTTLVQGADGTGGPPVDKSGYSLFKPTPDELLREMSTDRPDKTESPYTVDAGHFQFESDLVSYTHDRDRSGGGDVTVDGWAVAPINFKVGLCNRVDLQTVVETYNRVTTKDRIAGTKIRQSGFGDVASRLKVNLWGNDGGATAMALMPYVKFPANQDQLGNNSVEGGLIVPLALELPAGFSLGLMTQLDINRNQSGGDHHAEFVNTATLSHDIVGALGGYVEFFSGVSEEKGSEWVGTVDLGLTYGLTKKIQLDAGINIGVTDSADDLNPFVGLSWRF